MPHYERPYGVAGQIRFFLADYTNPKDGASPTFAAGDAKVKIDGGVAANATNLPTSEANGFFEWTYTAAEVRGKQIQLQLVDQDGPAWVTPDILIETEGNENAQHNRRHPGVILETTIESVSSQDPPTFIVADKPNDNNTLLDAAYDIFDDSTPDTPPDRGFDTVASYTGSSGEVVGTNALPFTIAAGDRVRFVITADVASAAEIAAEIKSTTITLPGQEAPPATPTLEQAWGWPYKVLRNRKRQSQTLWELMADNETTVDAKATLEDNAGVTIKQEIVSGP